MTPAVVLAGLFAAQPGYPEPARSTPDEPLAVAYSPAKATAYLDAVGVGWTRDRPCVSCHTNLPYLLARPALPGDAGWKEVRAFVEKDVEAKSVAKLVGPDAYLVAAALALAFDDARGGKLQPVTRQALDRMWKGQRPTGEWNWLKCGWPPMEHDDYYGATLAALAVGVAPEGYARTDAAKAGVDKLTTYLRKTPAPDLHHMAMLLWASTKLDGLLTADERAAVVGELTAKQRPDGGWSLPSLGEYQRRDGTANDPAAASDGYGTGLVVYVLRQAGAKADDPAVAKGVAWLRANQRESGRWFTRSLNTDKAHYITNAGTAFAVLALEAYK